MPEQEFDLYLALLARLLRLTEAQKQAISDELTDHLEERFHTLVEGGVPREDAIRRCLEELGDTAGLAQSFTSLAKRSRRRQLAQVSATTAVALLAAVWMLMTFWPQRPGGDPGQPAIAQGPVTIPATANPPVEKPVAAPAITFHDGRSLLPPGLLKVVPGANREMTLNELVALVKSETGVDCVLDLAHLKEGEISGEDVIDLISGVPWTLALGHMLEDVYTFELDWRMDEGIVFITMRSFADSVLRVRTFDVQPLLDKGHTIGQGAENDLLELIKKNTDGPWLNKDQGEPGGTISRVGNVIIVNQTERGLASVTGLLEMLNTAPPFAWLDRPHEDRAILEALQRPVQFPVGKIKLRELAELIRRECHIPVKLDDTHLKEDGLLGEEEVQIQIGNSSLANVLRWSLQNVNDVTLQGIADRGVLSLTTKYHVDDRLQTALLDISDILQVPDAELQFAELLKNHTSGDWRSFDNPEAGTAFVTPDGRLLLRQTDEVIAECQTLLAQVRSQLNNKAATPRDPQELITRFYKLPLNVARDLQEVLPQHIAIPTWTRGIESPNRPMGLISLITLDPRQADGNQLPIGGGLGGMGGGFMQFGVGPGAPEEPKTQEKPNDPPFQGVLVIRQTAAVHREIQQFISKVMTDADLEFRPKSEKSNPNLGGHPVGPHPMYFPGSVLGNADPATK